MPDSPARPGRRWRVTVTARAWPGWLTGSHGNCCAASSPSPAAARRRSPRPAALSGKLAAARRPCQCLCSGPGGGGPVCGPPVPTELPGSTAWDSDRELDRNLKLVPVEKVTVLSHELRLQSSLASWDRDLVVGRRVRLGVTSANPSPINSY